jgi:hypothetical protein
MELADVQPALAEDRPRPTEVQEQAERILSHPIFRDSPIQQRFLRFLLFETLAGRADTLKEFVIGQSVFQRGPDFDPQTDSIVRVHMRVFRKKLMAYYEGPGSDDRVLIESPHGHYALAIAFRPPAEPELPPGPVKETPALPETARTNPWMYVAGGVLAGILLTYALLRTGSREAPETASKAVAERSEWRTHPVWRGFLDPGFSTKLIVGTPFMVGFTNGIIVRDTTVNDVADLAQNKRIPILEKSLGGKAEPTELYTGLGEAAGINLLTQFYGRAGLDLPLVRNRLVKWQDFSAGNIIILSSLRFRTFEKEIEHPSAFEFINPTGSYSALRNLHPAPDEPSVYESTSGVSSGPGGIDYALVTVGPGTLAGRRIMTVGGSHTFGTEGAVEYITDPASLRELMGKLGEPKPGSPANTLQVLVKVNVKDRQVVSASYVTHRWLQ